MNKQLLSEQAIYFGDVKMPEGFEINPLKLSNDILQSNFYNKKFPFSKIWDMLNKYITEHIKLNYGMTLINKDTWGDIYEARQCSTPLLNINPVDLTNSPDYTLLYGVDVKECDVRIYYDDNRKKGRSWDIDLTNNKFIMFPSTCMYYITNNQKNSLNFIQTIIYESI